MGNKAKMYVDIMALNPEVTGSCFLCVVRLPNNERIKFIVDCGLFQEEDYNKYNSDFPFEAENINFALVTHNHVDHVGRLPLLYHNGFTGTTYVSKQTKVLLPLALNDSCHVLKEIYKRQNIKQLYSENDVETTLKSTVDVEFNKKIKITPNIEVTFLKNGHLIGAAMIFVQIHYPNEETINLMFSGDYNYENEFFKVKKIPKRITEARQTLILESTYGTIDSSEIKYEFEEKLLSSLKAEKTVISLVFSLGRAQEILLKLKQLQDKGKLDVNVPIFFDGKLAHSYTSLYLNNDNMLELTKRDFLPKNLTYVDSSSRSQILNTDTCKIIVTTSGMGTYGPAQVYLPYFISKSKAAIIFTGYTAEGTLGRNLQETETGNTVKIGGLMARKTAVVYFTTEFSAHAKADQLVDFTKQFNNLRAVIINHGNELSKEELATRIISEIDPPSVGIASRDYFFRIDSWGVNKTLSTKFK